MRGFHSKYTAVLWDFETAKLAIIAVNTMQWLNKTIPEKITMKYRTVPKHIYLIISFITALSVPLKSRRKYIPLDVSGSKISGLSKCFFVTTCPRASYNVMLRG
jgi:hypothetical protein